MKTVILSFGTLISASGFCQGGSSQLRGEENFNENTDAAQETASASVFELPENRFDFLLSLSLFRAMSHPFDSAYESEKAGYAVAPELVGVYSWKNWAFDLGIGFFTSQISGRAAHVVSPFGSDRSTIVTRAAVIDFSAGYYINSFLLVAPKIFLTSLSDSSFSPWGETHRPNLYTGARVMVLDSQDTLTWRYGVEFLSDSTIARRQVSMFGFFIQYGIPFDPEKLNK